MVVTSSPCQPQSSAPTNLTISPIVVVVPFAIAAKAAMPDKEIFVLFGDGAFGLTGFDVDTAVRFGQLSKYGEKCGDVANKLSATRYDLIVEAMGGYGELVTQPQDIRPA